MEESISFEDYLIKKKVDHDAFQNAEKDLFLELKELFDQVHPNSFTAQKLFLINPVRRKYPLKESSDTSVDKPKKMIKPKFKN